MLFINAKENMGKAGDRKNTCNWPEKPEHKIKLHKGTSIVTGLFAIGFFCKTAQCFIGGDIGMAVANLSFALLNSGFSAQQLISYFSVKYKMQDNGK